MFPLIVHMHHNKDWWVPLLRVAQAVGLSFQSPALHLPVKWSFHCVLSCTSTCYLFAFLPWYGLSVARFTYKNVFCWGMGLIFIAAVFYLWTRVHPSHSSCHLTGGFCCLPIKLMCFLWHSSQGEHHSFIRESYYSHITKRAAFNLMNVVGFSFMLWWVYVWVSMKGQDHCYTGQIQVAILLSSLIDIEMH